MKEEATCKTDIHQRIQRDFLLARIDGFVQDQASFLSKLTELQLSQYCKSSNFSFSHKEVRLYELQKDFRRFQRQSCLNSSNQNFQKFSESV